MACQPGGREFDSPYGRRVLTIYYRDKMGKCDDNGDVRKVAVAFCCVFSSRYLIKPLLIFKERKWQLRISVFALLFAVPELSICKKNTIFPTLFAHHTALFASTPALAASNLCISNFICDHEIKLEIQRFADSSNLYFQLYFMVANKVGNTSTSAPGF